MQPFSDLIEQRLLELNSNAFAVEQAAGLPADAIRNVIRSKTKDGPTISRAKEICDALGLDFYIGRKSDSRGFAEDDSTGGFAGAEASKAGFLPIPWHEAAKRKGSAPVALLQSWLATASLIPDFLKAIVPTSIQISLADSKNTVAVIDTSSPRKGSSGLWCYLDGATIGVCRAAFSGDVTVLFPAEDDGGEIRIIAKPTPPAFQILGKVVWLGMLT